jgi:hypothetical protein
MTTSINLTTQVQVAGMGAASDAHRFEVEAVDRIEVTVPAAGNVAVSVQPGGAEAVQLLFLRAGTYSDDLTYTVTDGAADVRLNAPQLFAGTGAVELLGTAQNTITFSNATAQDIEVLILVGRDATPGA